MTRSQSPSSSASPVPRGPVTVEWEADETVEATVDRRFLVSVLAETLAGRTPRGPLSVGLIVTTDEGIREMNRQHRGIDIPTDVLSFPMQQYERPEKPLASFPLPPDEPLPLGDVVISYERAVEQSREYGHSLERELAFLVVHGAMHLLGYDHETPEDADRMRREEEAVLQRMNLGRETSAES